MDLISALICVICEITTIIIQDAGSANQLLVSIPQRGEWSPGLFRDVVSMSSFTAVFAFLDRNYRYK